MRTIQICVYLSVIVLLSACASLSKDECLTADWLTIGYEDGAKGKPASHIGAHRKACAKHGIALDKTAYDQGYKEGLVSYCSYGKGLRAGQLGHSYYNVCPSNSEFSTGYHKGLVSFCSYDTGYNHGLSGKSYNQVCPQNLEANFLEGYDRGIYIYNLTKEHRNLTNDLYDIHEQQEENEKDIRHTKDHIANNKSLQQYDKKKLLEKLEEHYALKHHLANDRAEIETRIIEIRVELKVLGISVE